jgi:hypothetical protein
MADLTPAECARVARVALFATFAAQVERGHLTRIGLLALRSRLDSECSHEFEPGPDLDGLALAVNDALGVPVEVEDDPSGLLPPDQRD